MDHFKNIYNNMAVEYHRMIEYEDVDDNLYECIDKLLTVDFNSVLDIGSGTGRIPLLLSDTNLNVFGLDLYWEILGYIGNYRLFWEFWESLFFFCFMNF